MQAVQEDPPQVQQCRQVVRRQEHPTDLEDRVGRAVLGDQVWNAT